MSSLPFGPARMTYASSWRTPNTCGGPNKGGPRLNLSDAGGCAAAYFAIVQK